MKIQILTIFPRICEGVLRESMLKRAQEKGLATLEAVDLRDWATDKHRTTDDAPYGGGPGMVMKIEPIARALDALRGEGTRVLLMTPQGRRFNQKMAEAYSRESHLILICGHYEGVDQRVADHLVDDEISIGDYVLTNGALAALVFTDAVVRLIPGVLGDAGSAAARFVLHGPSRSPPLHPAGKFRRLESAGGAAFGQSRRHRGLAGGSALELTRKRRPDLIAKRQLPPCG